MANTYSQIYIQIVFVVNVRLNIISKQHREELHKYNTGIVNNREQKLLSIFSMPDHTHWYKFFLYYFYKQAAPLELLKYFLVEFSSHGR
jgi:hypothetical protein